MQISTGGEAQGPWLDCHQLQLPVLVGNATRPAAQVIKAVAEVVGPQKTGVRLSPFYGTPRPRPSAALVASSSVHRNAKTMVCLPPTDMTLACTSTVAWLAGLVTAAPC